MTIVDFVFVDFEALLDPVNLPFSERFCTLRGSTRTTMSEQKPFAIIKTSGRQVRVSAGDKIVINRIASDVGTSVTFTDVLATSPGDGTMSIGTPLLKGASVTAKVLEHSRGKKILIFKKRRRKGYTKRQGHRQELSTIQIESIA